MDDIPATLENDRQRRLNEEAAAWLLQLESDDTDGCRARFRSWLEYSAEHVQAFLETSAAYRDLDALPDCGIDLSGLVREAAAEVETNVTALPYAERIGRPPTFETQARSKHRHWRPIATAAAVAAAVSLIVLSPSELFSSAYTTKIGEQRVIKLSDGSIMRLNTHSKVKVLFSKKERRIELLEGEALFAVARDTGRPFRVLTDSASVQALGTQFDVYRQTGETTVSVVEGAVKISPSGAAITKSPPTMSLTADEGADVKSDGRIVKQRPGQVSRAIAWQQRQLDFNHATLQEVAREFNRYNALQIRVEDPAVGARVLNGVFNADEPGALLNFLAREPDLQIRHVGNEVVVKRAQLTAPGPGR